MSQTLLPSSLLSQLGERQADTSSPLSLSDRRTLTGMILCVGLVCLSVLGPYIAMMTSEGASEGSSVRQFSYLVLLAAVLIWAAPWRKGVRVIAVPLPLLAALVWCWLSVIWAIEPEIALRRLLLTTSVIWSVCILVHGNGYRKSVDALRIAMLIILIINYLTVWLAPEIGMHLGLDSWVGTALAGNWRGLTTHKNFAGAASALCLLLFLFDAKHIDFRIRVAVLLAASIFLYNSMSKTSMGMVGLSAVIGFSYNSIDRKLRQFLLPIGLLVICALATYSSAYLDVINRLYMAPTSFTGRGKIWSALMLYAKDHPFLGAGFESFWNIGFSSPIFIYGHGYETTVTVGHNGYLDLLITVGIPGLLLIVWGTLLWPLLRVISNERIDAAKGTLLCALILFCAGHNVTESSLFERDAFTGVFAIFAAAFASYTLPKPGKGRRRRSRAARAGNDIMAEMNVRMNKT